MSLCFKGLGERQWDTGGVCKIKHEHHTERRQLATLLLKGLDGILELKKVRRAMVMIGMGVNEKLGIPRKMGEVEDGFGPCRPDKEGLVVGSLRAFLTKWGLCAANTFLIVATRLQVLQRRTPMAHLRGWQGSCICLHVQVSAAIARCSQV